MDDRQRFWILRWVYGFDELFDLFVRVSYCYEETVPSLPFHKQC
jgi:hypothetical protein